MQGLLSGSPLCHLEAMSELEMGVGLSLQQKNSPLSTCLEKSPITFIRKLDELQTEPFVYSALF
jgi:hypothetical protein